MRWLDRLLTPAGSIRRYSSLSGDWMTCAIGEARLDYPDVVVYSKNIIGDPINPIDPELRYLGNIFHNQVAAGHRNKALQTYDRIQARVRVLLRKRKA